MTIKVVEIYVFNSESDIVRVVPLMPNSSWSNGGGLLGAEVGQGYLHRLPHTCRSTVGQSVERKVRTRFNKNDESEKIRTPIMERHLEMEIDKSTNPEHASKQPHELGNALDNSNNKVATDQVGAQGEEKSDLQAVSFAESTNPFPKLPIHQIKKENYSPTISDLPSPPKMSY